MALIDDHTSIVVRSPLGPPPLALRLAAVLAVPLLLYALVATGQKALDNYRLNQQAEALRSEVVALRNENIRLQQEIEAARSDAAIEHIAREQLGLVRPGDKPLVLVGASSTDREAAASASSAQATASAPSEPPPPVWRQWWDQLFG
jgi:cell division protein FtsL